MDGPGDRHTEGSKSEEKYCMTSFICENETNELIHKINTDPQTQKRKLWLPGGEDGRKGQ